MPDVIDELVTILGLEIKSGAKAVVAGFNTMLDGVTRYAGWAGAALTAASLSIGHFLERTNAASGELEKFQRLTGIGAERLQGWQYAAEFAGGSADALQADLMGLTKSMSSPIPGEFNHALFMLGVNLRKSNGEMKTADEVLMTIADKFEGMSKIRQIQWASRIGISDDTLLLLQMGRKEIERLRQQAKDTPIIVDEKHIKAAREFTIQLTLARRIISYVAQTMAAVAGPALKEIVKDSSEWLKINREFIQSKLANVVDGLASGFRRFWDTIIIVRDAIYSVIPSVRGFVDIFTEAETISQMVYGVLITMAVVLATLAGHWLLVAAGVTAAVLVLDDIITYFKGGESAIGAFIDKTKELWKEFSTTYPNLAKFAQQLWDLLSKVAVIQFNNLINAFKTLWEIIKQVADVLGTIFGFMLKIIDKAMGFTIGDFLKGDWLSSEWGSGRSPVGPVASQQGNTITVHQTISGANAPAIADETANRLQGSLLNIYSGGLASGVQ